MFGKIGLCAATALSMLLLDGCSKPAPFSCPRPDHAAPGAIRESAAQLETTQAALGAGSDNEIASVLPSVRARHPGAAPNLIADYLVVAFCPTVAARDAAADEKTQALDAFAERARRIAGSMPD